MNDRVEALIWFLSADIYCDSGRQFPQDITNFQYSLLCFSIRIYTQI